MEALSSGVKPPPRVAVQMLANAAVPLGDKFTCAALSRVDVLTIAGQTKQREQSGPSK